MAAMMVELPLLNGDHVLRRLDSDQIYGMTETDIIRRVWTWRFPFRKTITLGRATRFRIMTNQNIHRCWVKDRDDKSMTIAASLDSFCRMMGIEYKSCSETTLRDAIKYG